MNRTRLVTALLTLVAVSPLAAQMQRAAPPPKPASFQFTGAMTIPVFSYADYTDDIGWNAQGALVVRRGAFNHVRIEGEYNSVGSEISGAGSATVYGGGIGGGRVVIRGNVQSEGYLVVGAYNNEVCIGATCGSEVQFGTKVGFNSVLGGRGGRVRPVFDLHWLTTFSQPYVNIIAIGGGLRF